MNSTDRSVRRAAAGHRLTRGVLYPCDVVVGWALGVAVFGFSAPIVLASGAMRKTAGRSRATAPPEGDAQP